MARSSVDRPGASAACGRHRRCAGAGSRPGHLRQHREAVDAVVVDHRDEDGVVGRVRVAVVGRVVEERVAATELRVELDHRSSHQLAREDVHRLALGHTEQFVAVGEDRAREVLCGVEHARSAGAHERVHHRAGDRLEAIGEHGEAHPVDRRPTARTPPLRYASHLPPPFADAASVTITPPVLVRGARSIPEASTIVVSGAFTTAGP